MIARAAAVVVLLGLALPGCRAHWDGAYMRDRGDGFTRRTDWMSAIADDRLLSELALPGTQASAAFDVPDTSGIPDIDVPLIDIIVKIAKLIFSDATTTQTLDFLEQLNYGVRVFDIRLWQRSDYLLLVHGQSYLGKTFRQFLDTIQLFLLKNPSETVLVLITEQLEGDGNTETLREAMLRYLRDSSKTADIYLMTNDTRVTMGEARGKFLIVTKERSLGDLGIDYWNRDSFDLMDQCYLETNWDLYWQKWEPIKQHLAEARSGSKETFYVTYLNGYGGSFPYFVASGHWMSDTSAARLSTGLTTPGWWWAYPDFPRVACFLGICTIAFEGTNVLTRDKIAAYNGDIHSQPRTVGIVMADFPGDSLIETIIENNALL